jgi:hypothetical protein
MRFEERNDYRLKFIPPEDFISITMLVIRARVFLKIDTTDPEEILECIQNIFIAFDEFEIEFWFYHNSSCDSFLYVRIPYVDGEASFSIDEPDNIIGTKIFH